LFIQEKAGYVDVLMKLCLPNNTCIALKSFYYTIQIKSVSF